MKDEVLTLKEAAEMLKFSYEQVRRMVVDGTLPAFKTEGERSHYRILKSDVIKMLQK